MMKKTILSLLLVLMLLLAMVPSAVAAPEATGGEIAPITVVNPLYADVLAGFPSPQSPADSAQMPALFTLEEPKICTTPAEVAAELRENMMARNTSISITYTTQTQLSSDAPMAFFEASQAHDKDSPAAGDYLAFQYGGCSCSGGYSFDGTAYTYQLTYTVAYYTDAQQEQAVDDWVASFTDTYHLTDGSKSDYEKLRTIYDWLCENVDYDYTHMNDESYKLQFTAYAAAINKTAVCQGYATLFYRLALTCGIDARVVTGTANGGPHAWNIVQLGGWYYLIDATWGAGQSTPAQADAFFLRGRDHFDDHFPDERTVQLSSTLPISFENYAPPAAGDLNGDGGVTMLDVQCLYEYLSAGTIPAVVAGDPAQFLAVADVNGNAEVNILDYQCLYKLAIAALSA